MTFQFKCPYCGGKEVIKETILNAPVHVCDKVPNSPGIFMISKEFIDAISKIK